MKIEMISAAVLVYSLTMMISCFKGDKINDEKLDYPKAPKYVTNDSIKQNVSVIDSTLTKLQSDSTELSQGIYKLLFIEEPVQYKVGDIIVGLEKQGFLRRILKSTLSGNLVTLLTEQAALTDIFDEASIKFKSSLVKKISANTGSISLPSNKINYLAKGVSLQKGEFSHTFFNTIIHEDKDLIVKIPLGNIKFNPSYEFEVLIHSTKISKLGIYVDSAQLNMNCEVNLIANRKIQVLNFSKTLADVDVIYVVGGISALPVIVVVNTKLVAKLSADANASVNLSTGFNSNHSFTLRAVYEDSAWTESHQFIPNYSSAPLSISGNVKLTQLLSINPEVTVKFYGVAGPSFKQEMYEQFDMRVASPSLNWDGLLKLGINTSFGADVTIFGKTLAKFSRSHNTENELWKAPYQIAKISGDQQKGQENQKLAQLLKVKVTDNLNKPVKKAIVYFTATHGKVNPTSIETDTNGFAETDWILGTEAVQETKASVKKADGSDILDSPLHFTASTRSAVRRSWTGTLVPANYTGTGFTQNPDFLTSQGQIHNYVGFTGPTFSIDNTIPSFLRVNLRPGWHEIICRPVCGTYYYDVSEDGQNCILTGDLNGAGSLNCDYKQSDVICYPGNVYPQTHGNSQHKFFRASWDVDGVILDSAATFGWSIYAAGGCPTVNDFVGSLGPMTRNPVP